METTIDYVETFPNNYDGTPNMTVTHDGREVFPELLSNVEEEIIEYSPADETFYPGNEIALAQNQNNLAVAQIFQEVDSPNLHNQNIQHNSRIEEEKSFYPQNSESGYSKDFVDHFPDFNPNLDREAGHDKFVNFGEKLHHTGSTSLILSELDATAFDRSDEIEEDTKLVSTDRKEQEKVKSTKSGFKRDFEKSFNPGFSNFGNFEGNSDVTWQWGSKTE